MNFDSWTWILLLVILAFCVLPMIFMRRRRDDARGRDDAGKANDSDDRPS